MCGCGRQERLVVAREKAALEKAQNAALCSVCRTPVRDAPVNANLAPSVGMLRIVLLQNIKKLKPRYLVCRRLTEHSSASGAFTVVEVVSDWHWLYYCGAS